MTKLSDTQLREIARDVLEHNPEAEVVIITDDGTPFIAMNPANNHAANNGLKKHSFSRLDVLGTKAAPETKPKRDHEVVIAEVMAKVGEPGKEPDDLTTIKGIGPKTATFLKEVGIVSYLQLAKVDDEAAAALEELDEGFAFKAQWAVDAQAVVNDKK